MWLSSPYFSDESPKRSVGIGDAPGGFRGLPDTEGQVELLAEESEKGDGDTVEFSYGVDDQNSREGLFFVRVGSFSKKSPHVPLLSKLVHGSWRIVSALM